MDKHGFHTRRFFSLYELYLAVLELSLCMVFIVRNNKNFKFVYKVAVFAAYFF
jgi:hypothetical protein